MLQEQLIAKVALEHLVSLRCRCNDSGFDEASATESQLKLFFAWPRPVFFIHSIAKHNPTVERLGFRLELHDLELVCLHVCTKCRSMAHIPLRRHSRPATTSIHLHACRHLHTDLLRPSSNPMASYHMRLARMGSTILARFFVLRFVEPSGSSH